MKKFLAVLLAMAMMLCVFTGCGKKEEAQQADSVQVANPMAKSDAASIKKTFGSTFTEPEGAGNAEYFIYNGEMAEMQFTLAGGATQCSARLKPADNFEDISGAYYDWTLDEPDEFFSNFIAQSRTYVAQNDNEDDVMSYLWYDGYSGMMYSLTATGSDLNGFDPMGAAIQLMGDDYIDYNRDYTGSYEDADLDTVDMTRDADGNYAIVIGIYRLCEIEATGYNMDGAVEFGGLDPNGEAITGIFYPNGDAYDLMFTTSKWDYLEEGTTFEGFTLK